MNMINKLQQLQGLGRNAQPAGAALFAGGTREAGGGSANFSALLRSNASPPLPPPAPAPLVAAAPSPAPAPAPAAASPAPAAPAQQAAPKPANAKPRNGGAERETKPAQARADKAGKGGENPDAQAAAKNAAATADKTGKPARSGDGDAGETAAAEETQGAARQSKRELRPTEDGAAGSLALEQRPEALPADEAGELGDARAAGGDSSALGRAGGRHAGAARTRAAGGEPGQPDSRASSSAAATAATAEAKTEGPLALEGTAMAGTGERMAVAAGDSPATAAGSFEAALSAASAQQAHKTGDAGHGQAAGVSPAQVELAQPLHDQNFAPEMAARLSLLAADGVQQAELHLNPAEMGPVAVQIVVDGQQAQISFHSEQAETRAVLERGLPELAAALRDNGLTLSGGGVFQQARDQGQADGRPAGPDAGRGRADTDDIPLAAAAAPSRPQRSRGVLDLYA